MKFSSRSFLSASLLIIVSFLLFTSCVDDIRNDIEDMKAELELQKELIGSLQKNVAITGISYDSISGIYAITLSSGETVRVSRLFIQSVDESDDYWSFKFSDGQIVNCTKKSLMPELLYFGFKGIENSKTLVYDIYCTIKGDNINGIIPFMTEEKNLIPCFDYLGKDILVDGVSMAESRSMADFSKPLKVDVIGYSGDTLSYTANIISFTGLPLVYVDVDYGEEVVSKEQKLPCSIKIVEDFITKSPGDVLTARATIKGRGNSTWKRFDKKPYKIKFESKQSVLGMPSDKEWVLLANHSDKTLLRNKIALFIGSEIAKMDYTCRSRFVELILNGRYVGSYQLGEQQKISKNRVNVGDDGYLLEIDLRAYEESDARYFKCAHIESPVNVKDPNVEYNTLQFEIVKRYVQKCDSVLFGKNFMDPATGYAAYIDVDSFVDWYLINEIGKNMDAMFITSCYMHYKPGGKLFMGPIWDFDLAFGNVDYGYCTQPTDVYIYNIKWYTRLFSDPAFSSKVKERFNFYYDNLDLIYAKINEYATCLRYSAIENNTVWNVLYNYTWPNDVVLGRYENEVNDLKVWIQTRMDWLKNYYDTNW